MTRTSYGVNRNLIACLFVTIFTLLLVSSCKKNNWPPNQGHPPAKYDADVLDKWMTMQLRLMRNTSGVQNQAFSRYYVYAGITALESLAPGLPASYSRYRNWNGITGLPAISHSQRYYYPASLNAAMAAINRSFFPLANANDKLAIDSLENALRDAFVPHETQVLLTRSADFGKAVAGAVFNWAETDGYKNAGNPYTPPVGPGLWKPTSPGTAAASPYWGNNRPVIAASIQNTMPVAPIAYSAIPNSPFYNMVKQVYDVSQNLTDDQKAMAFFWRDVPGLSSPGHWLSILQQVIRKEDTRLDKAALAYALTGAAINDALISCWKAKYQFNLVRPVSYIREEMGDAGWNTLLGTPPHPEYPSAHSSLSAAAAGVLEKIFGNSGSFTDHSYDYMGMAPRNYTSFTSIGEEAGLSRLYAGIHYKPSIDAGLLQGRKVVANIFSGH